MSKTLTAFDLLLPFPIIPFPIIPSWHSIPNKLMTLTDAQPHSLLIHSSSFALSYLVLSCLLSLMATLEERIRDLEAEIVKNTVRFDKAIDDGNEEDKKMYANLITAKETRLNTLLQQQSQAQAQGE